MIRKTYQLAKGETAERELAKAVAYHGGYIRAGEARELVATLAALRKEREDLRRTLEWICSEHGSVDEGVLAVARAALAGTADGPPVLPVEDVE